MKQKEVEINQIELGGYFCMINTQFNPERVYYMRRMKRKPKYSPVLKRDCIPIQCYGFVQGQKDSFNKLKPAHFCMDGRYKAVPKLEGWKEKPKKIRIYKIKEHIYKGIDI